MAIVDDILRGVVSPDNNEALFRLAQILGNKLVPVGQQVPDTTILVLLSGSLLPVWIGLLFLILAYIGVSGVIRSAQEGKLLGREWSTFKVPLGFIAAVILLTPVPGFNGSVVAQYAFVKGAVFGSNAADYALKQMFASSAAQAVAETYSFKDLQVEQVNRQMKIAYQQFYCGSQLSTMGYGSREDFFILLNTVCKIPTENTGVFKAFFLPADDNEVSRKNDRLQNLSNQLGGVDYKRVTQLNTSSIDNVIREGQGNPQARELSCYFNSFQQYMLRPLSSEVAAKFVVDSTKPPLEFNLQGAKPNRIKTESLKIKPDHLPGAWIDALDSSYKCVMTNAVQNTMSTITNQPPSNQDPWRKGWVYAASSVSDSLNNYNEMAAASKLPLSQLLIKEPEPQYLDKTLQDRDNQAILVNNLIILKNSLDGSANKIDSIAAGYGGLINDPATSNSAKAKLLAAISTAAVGTQAPSEMANARRETKLVGFLNSFVGKGATAPGRLIEGKATKAMAAMVSKVDKLLEVVSKSERVKDAVGKIPFVGNIVSAASSLAATVFTPSPTKLAIFVFIIAAMNIIILAPQVVLLVVLLLWLLRVAVMYLILPIAVVIIAIPGTRAGHDIWKSALAIILVPLLAIFFYMISFVTIEVMYRVVFSWAFEPFIDNGFLGGIGNAIISWLTGEWIFRFAAAFFVAIGTTVLMMLMILRGPDYVARQLHLNSSSGELGGELEGEMTGMRQRLRL